MHRQRTETAKPVTGPADIPAVRKLYAFEGALIVANTIENSGPDAKVHLSVKASGSINLFGSKTEQDIVVPENAEEVVRFRVRVNDRYELRNLLRAHTELSRGICIINSVLDR